MTKDCLKITKPLWTMPRVNKKDVCPYCRGSGSEFVLESHPELYGPNEAPPEFTVPCRVCHGLKKDYAKENRDRLELPYYFGLSAFNPSAYIDSNGKVINFADKFGFVKKYVENYREVDDELEIKGMYIWSPTAGNGKTLLASCVCFEMYNRHQLMPIYVTENSLLDKLQANVSDSQISPRETFQKAPILFIDDMWRKTTGREWVNDELFNIIDYRYTHKLPTIITSNVGLDSNKIDARLASRLNTMCVSVRIPDVEIRDREKMEKRKKLFEMLNKADGKEETNNE